MTLSEGQIGQFYFVKELKLEHTAKQRLEALGLIDGTKVELLNQNHNGAIVFKVRGTRLAIGKKIADAIFVEEVA
ncbi:FeoA family protein [Anaerocolumna sp.]|uniref:FeoA family protein n=1 Tax=Anaerocolumna sp. TaxID=2041569 RepID=UPI0028A92C52|nr:ferrous iron transport protein A [Anaerocolumna sp.]